MTADTIKTGLTTCAAIFGLLAAALWLWASFQVVRPDDPRWSPQDVSILLPDKKGRGYDVLGTAARQTYLNAWAAGAAAMAAICQVALLKF